jgi:hypothetical protein
LRRAGFASAEGRVLMFKLHARHHAYASLTQMRPSQFSHAHSKKGGGAHGAGWPNVANCLRGAQPKCSLQQKKPNGNNTEAEAQAEGGRRKAILAKATKAAAKPKVKKPVMAFSKEMADKICSLVAASRSTA